MIPKEVKPTQKEKTEMTTDKNPELLSFSSLPDEIVENCLARISKWDYPSLSLVSKNFHSFLSSPELYTTRTNIGTTEPCLYFCFKLPKQESPSWFTLWMEPPDETLTERYDEFYDLPDDYDYPNDYTLVTVPSSSHSYLHVPYYYSTVVVRSEIYLIGGSYNAPASSAVRILDCRNHTWRDGPSMMVARDYALAVHLDEKIYVMGGCCRINDSWMEVLDVKTQTWKPLPCHGAAAEEVKSEPGLTINVLEGNIYAIAEMKDYLYDPKESTWEVVETHSSIDWLDSWCVIDNVMYCYTNLGYCMWYDSKSKEWREVKGLNFGILREGRTFGARRKSVLEILNHGGKLLVMWIPSFEEGNGKPERTIWCAKIALAKSHGGEIWGTLEWTNTVLTVSESYESLEESYTYLSCAVVSI